MVNVRLLTVEVAGIITAVVFEFDNFKFEMVVKQPAGKETVPEEGAISKKAPVADASIAPPEVV